MGAWPPVGQRHHLRTEALEIIRTLLDGATLQYSGDHSKFRDAGFTDIALVQVDGDQQDAFLGWAGEQLLPALRELPGS